MIKRSQLIPFVVLGLLALSSACSPRRVFNDDPNSYERKSKTDPTIFNAEGVNDRVISETRYNIKIFPSKILLGFGEERPICNGEATVKLHYPEPRFEITPKTFKISCMGLPITPNQLQPSAKQPADGRGPGVARFSTATKSHACLKSNGCLDNSMTNVLVMSFTPGVPYYLPSIVQNLAELDKLKEFKQTHRIKFSDNRPDVIGQSRVKILETSNSNPNLTISTFLPEDGSGSAYTFDEVVHWERELIGFEEFPSEIGGVLPMLGYTHMEWWSSTRPIAMVKFRIRAILKTVLGADFLNSLDEEKRRIVNAFNNIEVILQFHMIEFSEQ